MDLGTRAMILRLSEDRKALLAMNADILQNHPTAPGALNQVVRNAGTILGMKETARAIAEHDAAVLTGRPPETTDLTPDAWLLMSGIVFSQENRYASALAAFDTLLTRHDEWTPLLQAWRLRCMRSLLHPISDLQACLDAAATNAQALMVALQLIAHDQETNPEAMREISAFLHTAPACSGLDALRDKIDLNISWRADPPDEKQLMDDWRCFLAAYPEEAWTYDNDFSFELGSRLPTDRAVDVLQDIGQAPQAHMFRLRAAEKYIRNENYHKAAVILSDSAENSRFAQSLRFMLVRTSASADTTRSVLSQIHRDYITSWTPEHDEAEYQILDLDEEWAAAWEELIREDPMLAMRHRLNQTTEERLPGLLALRDSLQSLDLLGAPFDNQFQILDAMTADHVDIEDIIAEPDPRVRGNRFIDAYITADHLGDHALQVQLAKAEIELSVNLHSVRYRLHKIMPDAGDDLVKSAIARLDELGADPESSAEVRALAALKLEGIEAAKAEIDHVDFDSWTNMGSLTRLASLYRHFKMTDQFSAVVERLRALYPDAYSTHYLEVELLEMAGSSDKALAVLKDLAAEYPGSQDLKQALMKRGESVQALDEIPDALLDRADLFIPFGDDLDDLDAIRSRRVADLDTIHFDTICLLKRTSHVLSGLDNSYLRKHLITQVLTRAGAQAQRSYSFVFDPNNGVPHVRTARVLTPDGEILDTDLGDILVRAPEGGNWDVSDSREMVIPLRGVEPGVIIDLAYDVQDGSYLGDTWSHLDFFLSDAPVREYIVELFAPSNHPVQTVVHGDVTTHPLDTLTGVRRWTIHDLAMPRDEENRPSLTEVLPWVGMTTFADWDAAGRQYAAHFWKVIDDSPRIQELAASLTHDVRSNREKAEAIYRYVLNEITPLAVELAAGRLLPSSSTEVLDRGWGDCKDKSHLLITLLRAAGIEARPVLVSTIGHYNPREDFPSLSFFNHMIVQVTDLKGDPYCDPLNGGPTLLPLPAEAAGRLGLHIDPDGTTDLRIVAPPRPEDHISDLEIDVRPVGERALRYDIKGRFTGNIAAYMKQLVAFGDTNTTRFFLDQSVGYGVPVGVPIQSWSATELENGHIEVAMTYVDSTWAGEGVSSAELRNNNEASVYWGLPSSEDRLYDVVFLSPYTARLVLRLHGSDVWTPSDLVVALEVDNDFARGSIVGKVSKEDGHRLVTVEHEYSQDRRVVPQAEYEGFRRDAITYFMYSAQRYEYRRTLDEDKLKAIDRYVRDNPEDEGFRVRAVFNLLGTDMGGQGVEGEPRRVAAMKLLAPLLAQEHPSPQSALLAAGVYAKRNQYQRADSLVTAVLESNPDDLFLQGTAISLNIGLEQWGEVADRSRKLANMTGSKESIITLILAMMHLGRDDQIPGQVERLRLIGTPVDSLTLVSMRCGISEAAGDLEAMKNLLSQLEELGANESDLDDMRCAILTLERRSVEAIPIQERRLAENPGNSMICNNLAWTYALAGHNLDRALMLAEAALLLSCDPSTSRNTYATVLARMGKWREARDIYRDIFEHDDRPLGRIVNGYFLGLAEAQLGHPDKARTIWQSISDLPVGPRWKRRVLDSLKALDEGGDLLSVIFEG